MGVLNKKWCKQALQDASKRKSEMGSSSSLSKPISSKNKMKI